MMVRINDILDAINIYLPEADTGLVEKAYVFSAKMHAGQKRLSGEPYLSHPLAVSYILAELKLDLASIAAGLLHDAVEDTLATTEELAEMFGKDVAFIVDGVTKLSKLQFQSSLYKQAENIRKMILAMSKDIRVLLIKLADRLHNMRTLEFQKEIKQKAIAAETLDIYAPLASRLGIDWIKQELEDLSFKYLYADDYADLKARVEERLGQRKAYVEEVKDMIARRMAEYAFSCRVLGRPKHLYSIYRKMNTRNLPLEQIYDLMAFRIILKSTKECYEALGIVHSLWKPVPGRFKDYISLPKANMYQSLHTTLIGPDGERMEVQIRTDEMDQVAREGIAAHWLYKEGRILTKESTKSFEWLNQLAEWQRELQDPREFLESVKMDLFPNEIWVLTPAGEVKEFPRGATLIDFAYAIHTEVGHHCSGAKLNGRLVQLNHEMQTGDVVEITTSPRHVPSRDWLKFAKTGKAIARIRQWIKTEERSKSMALGKELCEKEFKRHRIDFNEALKNKGAEMTQWFSFKHPDDLLLSVGYGKISQVQLVKRYMKEVLKVKGEAEFWEDVVKAKPNEKEGMITINGLDNIMTHISRCCNPVPGDDVIGYITRGRGITIHRTTCSNVKNIDPERKVEIDWGTGEGYIYPVKIETLAIDKKGILAEVSNVISSTETNISDARVKIRPDGIAVLTFIVDVTGTEHLRRVISGIRRCDGVTQVRRVVSKIS